MPLVECVPNFSEGRRPEVIQAIGDAIARVPTVQVLDVSSDPSHNRTVLTFVAEAAHAVEAAFAGIREARDTIDLTRHHGEHPRMGAADVVPFVPLDGSTMEDCILLARALGERVGRELGIPVYLYERAATRPDRQNLADVRRGEFEGLREEIGRNPLKTPDFGPPRVHPTAGAVAIGARPFLVAFNVYFGSAANLAAAKAAAEAVRESSGGLRYVKGLGLEVNGQAQVSMNMVDTERTPLHRAFDLLRLEAKARGVPVTSSEIVGLVPQAALDAAAARHLQLARLSPSQILERRVGEAVAGGPSLAGFMAQLASPGPVPGGGSAAAVVGAMAAALVQMVAGLTAGRKKYAAVDAEMQELGLSAARLRLRLSELAQRDAEAYTAVASAYKLPQDSPEQLARRRAAVREGLLGAARVPLETAEAARDLARLAAAAAERGNRNAVSDAGVAALLAEAACRGAVFNVRTNLAAMEDPEADRQLAVEADRLLAETREWGERAVRAVEEVVGSRR
jgi:glutamate formiminotransferase/formiminotetrahydrofolate cyclodeaminase